MTTSNRPFPPLSTDARAALRADIERHGIIYPVVVNTTTTHMIDGHTRASIAKELGIHPVPTMHIEVSRADEDQLAVTLNLLRRHLTPEARKAAFADLTRMGWSQPMIAAAAGVAQSTVSETLAGEVIEADNPTPVLDKQGRPPGSRGGRPRKPKAEAPDPEAEPVPGKPTFAERRAAIEAGEQDVRDMRQDLQDEAFIGAGPLLPSQVANIADRIGTIVLPEEPARTQVLADLKAIAMAAITLVVRADDANVTIDAEDIDRAIANATGGPAE